MKSHTSCLAWLLAIFGALLALCGGGCAGSLPADTMPKIARVLEATKTAHTLVCNPPPTQPLQCRVPEQEVACDVSAAHINGAIEVYTEINNQLKADE